jgi:hypothetical protein
MNVEAINVWAQLIASLGVIVSLFYLAAQVRQNTRSSRAIVVDSLARSMHDLAFEIAQNDQLLKTATTLDWNSATELERARFASFMLGYFKLFENAWFQMRKGTLEPEQWEGYDAFLRNVWAQPTVKAWWTQRKTFFAPGFRQYVENCQEAPNVPTLSDLARGGINTMTPTAIRPARSDG